VNEAKAPALLVAAAVGLAAAASGVAGLGAAGSGARLSVDDGAAGTWQRLLKLQTTASVLHTTAHPDDEQAGVLALLSRGRGVRLGLMTLTRGEAGDNAIGSELFDALGLVRTEELLLADLYYGVDDQYFTSLVDYGYSKRLEEAFEKWGRENVLREVVRVIRMDRPLVLLSRFRGDRRDGHGNHEAAGLITREAFRAAGDPAIFPEQIAEGLTPWAPRKLYIGGVREDEAFTIRVDPGEYAPWLGETYQNFGFLGYSLQRSQTSGRLVHSRGPQYAYYERVGSTVEAPGKEQSFFDGIDTTLSGMFKTLERPAPAGAETGLAAVESAVKAALEGFRAQDPSASVPALARGLAATREVLRLVVAEPDAAFLLRVKERQFEDAITTALGIDFAAMAQPAGSREPTGPFAAFVPPPTMGAPVPGQTFEVKAQLTNRGNVEIALAEIALVAGKGFDVRKDTSAPATLHPNETATQVFTVTLADDTPVSRPHFARTSIRQNRYDILDAAQAHRPWGEPAATVLARFTVNGVSVEARQAVTRREAALPYGFETRELSVVPAIALTVTPETAIVPLAAPRKTLSLRVDVLNNWEGKIAGRLSFRLPPGWTSDPESQVLEFTRSGEVSTHRFLVRVPALEDETYEVQALATAKGREFREGYELVAKRDLETRYLYRPALTVVHGIDVKVPPGLKVGYVMGVGDQVPVGLAQLGAQVTLLEQEDLATGSLRSFDAIMTGTRAYAVREDLRTHNRRLLDYVKEGGNLIVLYNTQELVPDSYAPFPGQLDADAEEVSEEDSPVDILAPESRVLAWPNRITKADFDGWVEQRGSKFWSAWDKSYTALIATRDKGQQPQGGGWLYAPYGKGHYTYFAYALHRQLPYGVPGAYRLLANLLALGKPGPVH
jgi:LmbE family N-acetylglucosaminyl deacetylase